MTPTLRGMTTPVIKSLGHLPSASVNDSEALMAADNNTMVDLDKASHLNICGFAAL
jgi:hypothetical protein